MKILSRILVILMIIATILNILIIFDYYHDKVIAKKGVKIEKTFAG